MKNKDCKRCLAVKDIGSFAIYNGKPYSYCRACQSEMSSEYYHANKAKCAEADKAYREKNREKLAMACRAWRENNPNKVQANNKARYQRDKDKFVLINRKKNLARYGISVEKYEAMYREQNGVCAVCEKINVHGRRLSVDHNHATGAVRSLLCNRCNLAIGYAKESIAILKKIIAYLEKHETLTNLEIS